MDHLGVIFLILFPWLLCEPVRGWTADSYWNSRYTGRLNYVDYINTDVSNGLWSDEGSYQGPYLLPSSQYTGQTCSGCTCDNNLGYIHSCTGTTIVLVGKVFTNITAGTFLNPETVTSIKILNVPSFNLIDNATFFDMINLDSLIIQLTGLTAIPDLSRTALATLNLASNALTLSTMNWIPQTLPTTLKRIALMNNQLYWLPSDMFSGTIITILSLSNNRFKFFPTESLRNIPELLYLGMDGNLLKSVSKKNLAVLENTQIQHLNLSNNEIFFMERLALSQLPELKILELHQNKISDIPAHTLHGIGKLLHLDLNNNYIQILNGASITSLPELVTLRLHTQKGGGLSVIRYNAFKDMNLKLENLWVSNNALTSYPHQVLSEQQYDSLLNVYAEYNLISNVSILGLEAYENYMFAYYTQKQQDFVPFATTPNVLVMHLSGNLITGLEELDFCNMSQLTYLYLAYNTLNEDTMADNVFTCLTQLLYLDVSWNSMQYVPQALITAERLPAITTLLLTANKLTFLLTGTFKDLTTLQILNLNLNGIISIEDDTFPVNIRVLRLTNNIFRFLHEGPFTGLVDLQSLYLGYNDITNIPDTAFHNCSSLRNIILNNNKITRLMKTHFKDSPLTGDIHFNDNQIGYIADGTFAHVASANSIDLSSNRLNQLPSGGDFADLSISLEFTAVNNYITSIRTGTLKNFNCKNLFMSNNKISYIESKGLDNVAVTETIDFRDNLLETLNTWSFHEVSALDMYMNDMFISKIPRQAFKDVVIGRNMYMENNKIATIEVDAFSTLVLTKNFNLANNGLKTIEGKIFGDGSSIGRWLYLDDNNITQIPDDTFQGASVRFLNLNNNEILVFPGTALGPLELETILIMYNDIQEVTLGTFQSFSALQTLDLTGNQLTAIPAGLFDPLVSLKRLVLRINDILIIEYGAFVGQENSLEEIQLQRNDIQYFPTLTAMRQLTRLDLSHNDIESLGPQAFHAADKLNYINLNYNSLDCDCEMYITLNFSKAAIVNGVCAGPENITNVTFAASETNLVNYFTKVSTTGFQCSGRAVLASAPGDYQINVTWLAPVMLYPPDVNTPLDTAYLPGVGNWSFVVECTSNEADILTVTVEDLTGGLEPVYAHVFTAEDGVAAGTDYICTVQLEHNGYLSGKSSFAFITTPTTIDGNWTVGENDYLLLLTHYDFKVSHEDFTYTTYTTYPRPTYVPSPYGSWLAVSNTPLADTFSDWFHHKDGVNVALQNAVVLTYDAGNQTHRFADGSFLPIDTLGYGPENQRDCKATLHNFGFTSAIRVGMLYEGVGTISIGGGDELWLYINKTLVLEIISEPSTLTVTCKLLDLTPAATPGGGYVIPQEGTIVGERCETTRSLLGQQVFLELQIGDTYHFDLFHTERRGCRSSLYIETKDIRFMQNSTDEDPPIDYFAYVNEDLHLDGIIAEMSLTDVFSVGPIWQVNINRGNEARHVTVKLDSAANRLAGEAPPAPVYNYTYISGVSVPFVECDDITLIPDPHIGGTESFTMTAGAALLTLSSSLDHEVSDRYVIVMAIVDAGVLPVATGQIVVRVQVLDVNDNCPVLNQTNYEFEPVPALELNPILNTSAIDADAGQNANISYMVSNPVVDPPLSRYNSSFDLYRVVYNETSELTFTMVAIDSGVPRRGAVATVRLLLSNTCLLSVLFEEIQSNLEIDGMTGQVWFRIPQYWVYDFECQRVAGMSSGFVLDSQLTASSYEYYSYPGRGRVNETYDPTGLLTGGWVAAIFDTNQWLQLDMTAPYKYQKVIVQGREDAAMWVTTYMVWYSNDGVTFLQYADENTTDIFVGPSGQDHFVTQDLIPPILAQYIRINPQTWVGGISLRLEAIGCTQEEQKYYDTTCQRCDWTYYCPGDGGRYPCGRCDPLLDGSTCPRSPTEHSFGAQEECSVCPAGWVCSEGQASPCGLHQYVLCNETYCPETCIQCESGHVCRGGVRYLCAPGTYSDGTDDTCVMCSPGTYQNASGTDHCLPCPSGFISSKMKEHCTPCPAGTWSDGSGGSCVSCTGSECRCLLEPYPCYDGVICRNVMPDGVSYVCDACTPGYYGDGFTCTDVDECVLYNPCWNGTDCVNTSPGYQCRECPVGYSGAYKDAISVDTNVRVYSFCGQTYPTIQQQTCQDVDECASNNGGCDVNSDCFNTIGSYTCGFCKKGYLGDAFYGCYGDNFCTSSKHNCSADANCIYTGPAAFRCECMDGYAGNGEFCGLDPDLDGHPTEQLLCADIGCFKDNCPDLSNSGQEDIDGDFTGDSCDYDDDNDVTPDEQDNCQFVVNYDQADGDGDGVGDACDNCPADSNADQAASDNDGVGDQCDDDDDNDGILDVVDNCPLVVNPGQEDVDADGVGDLCDNCPTVANSIQSDTDLNGFGDDCDVIGAVDKDRDGDGIIDLYDNCENTINPDQSDIDNDGVGDACDDDRDGDGLANDADNCPYISNADQTDTNGNGIGDVCENDTDGDGLINSLDHCPLLADIAITNLTSYTVIELDPGIITNDSVWKVNHDGREIRQLADTEMPLLLIGSHGYSVMDYSGTWFVDTDEGNDYIGFVFGYQSNRRFYLMMWRHGNRNYGGITYRGGIKGAQIKVVDSSTGPGTTLANALWHSADTTGEVRLLWHDPTMTGWSHKTAYRWHLQWRPSLGIIRLRIVEGKTTLVDSGDLYDLTISGGRVGVFVFNQSAPIWSDLVVRCVERENLALSFDGIDDFVTIRNISDLEMEESFTMEVFVLWQDTVTAARQPILCTTTEVLCMFVENSIFSATLGNDTITGTTTLAAGYWHHLFMRYEFESDTLSLYVNGTLSGAEASSENIKAPDWSNQTFSPDLYLGRDNTSYFTGLIDDVRIYRIWLTDAELDEHIGTTGTRPYAQQMYLSLAYSMTDDSDDSVVMDASYHGYHGVLYGDTKYVDSSSHQGRFQVTYPSNK